MVTAEQSKDVLTTRLAATHRHERSLTTVCTDCGPCGRLLLNLLNNNMRLMRLLPRLRRKYPISVLILISTFTVIAVLLIHKPGLTEHRRASMDSRSIRHSSRYVPGETTPNCYMSNESCPHIAPGDLEGTVPMAYVITPTYQRLAQKADMLRLCYTLRQVPRVHWILVEDSAVKTKLITDLLKSCTGPIITHLNAVSKKGVIHRGTQQRNAALNWLRSCFSPGSHRGGVYFADDDNTFDLKVFEAVRWTRRISVWLTGFISTYLYEGPKCTKGKVTGWQVGWGGQRLYPLDMASFSLGLDLVLSHPQAVFNDSWKKGFLETNFLQKLGVTINDFSPQPDENCSTVLAWHTKTVKPGGKKPKVRGVDIVKRPATKRPKSKTAAKVQLESLLKSDMDAKTILEEMDDLLEKHANVTIV